MNGIKQINGKIYVVYHLQRELKGHTCVKKILRWNVIEKKSNVFNWHEKKHAQKKIAQPSPQKFNGPSLMAYSIHNGISLCILYLAYLLVNVAWKRKPRILFW